MAPGERAGWNGSEFCRATSPLNDFRTQNRTAGEGCREKRKEGRGRGHGLNDIAKRGFSSQRLLDARTESSRRAPRSTTTGARCCRARYLTTTSTLQATGTDRHQPPRLGDDVATAGGGGSGDAGATKSHHGTSSSWRVPSASCVSCVGSGTRP